MRSVGQLAQSVIDHRIGGVSYCDYHGSTSCVGSACCRSVGIYCDVCLRFPNWGDYALRVYLPVTLVSPWALGMVREGFPRGLCVRQILYQTLDVP